MLKSRKLAKVLSIMPAIRLGGRAGLQAAASSHEHALEKASKLVSALLSTENRQDGLHEDTVVKQTELKGEYALRAFSAKGQG